MFCGLSCWPSTCVMGQNDTVNGTIGSNECALREMIIAATGFDGSGTGEFDGCRDTLWHGNSMVPDTDAVRNAQSEFFRIVLSCFLLHEKTIQCGSGDTEDLGGPALVAIGLFQGVDNIRSVELWLATLQGVKSGHVQPQSWRQVFGPDPLPFAFYQSKLYRINQFANIARPCMRHQYRKRCIGQADFSSPGCFGELGNEMLEQKRNIFSSVPQGKDNNRHYTQPVE